MRRKYFFVRIKRKWIEYFKHDPSGITFFLYCIRYCVVKLLRIGMSLLVYVFVKGLNIRSDRLSVSVCITGGLGDKIVHRRFFDEIAARCPRADFFLFCVSYEQAKWVFGYAPNIRKILPYDFLPICSVKNPFDVSITMNTFVFFNNENFNEEKVRKLAPELFDMFKSVNEKRAEWEQYIANHPFSDGESACKIVKQGFNRYSFISHMLDIGVPPLGLKLPLSDAMVKDLGLKYPSYVTINTGFDAHFILMKRFPTKCYPVEYWEQLVILLKKKYPGIGIIQVGGRNSAHIKNVDEDLSGKTTLEEAAGILKNSRLHIDIEGGLVHVCASIGTPCVVMFGPTNIEYFGYPQNVNVQAGDCHDCWWRTELWMDYCKNGHPRPECMYCLTPEKVLDAASPVLDKIAL